MRRAHARIRRRTDGASPLETLAEIEARFTRARKHRPDLPGAVARAMAVVAGPQIAAALWRTTNFAEILARRIDDEAGDAPELPYHNRHHFAEAVESMGRLCRIACDQGRLPPNLACLGVAAMVAHDWGHDGTPGGDGVLETKSARLVLGVAGDLPPPARGALVAVILATDPALVAENAARAAGELPHGPLGPAVDLLCHLANEADVFASLLPNLGWSQAAALAAEWRGHPRGRTVQSFASRLSLLRIYQSFSPAAEAAGLAELGRRQLDTFARVAARLGAGAAEDDGAAALDQMPKEEAWRLYSGELAQAA